MTPFSRSLITRALSEIELAGGYVVVKNPDPWASLARGGDIDLAVSDTALALEVLVGICGTPWLVVERSYVTAVYYDWGEVDLIRRLEWRSRGLLSFDQLFARAAYTTDGILAASVAHQAIAAWIVPILHHGNWLSRYIPLVEQAFVVDADELQRVLRAHFGIPLAAELERLVRGGRSTATSTLVRSLRRRLALTAARQAPVDIARGMLRHAHSEISLRLSPPLPVVRVSCQRDIEQAVAWAVRRAVFVSGVAINGPRRAYVSIRSGDSIEDVLEGLTHPQARSSPLKRHRNDRSLRSRCCLMLDVRGWGAPNGDFNIATTLDHHVAEYTESRVGALTRNGTRHPSGLT